MFPLGNPGNERPSLKTPQTILNCNRFLIKRNMPIIMRNRPNVHFSPNISKYKYISKYLRFIVLQYIDGGHSNVA